MDQHSILRFLYLKELDAIRIHRELDAMLGPDAVPCSTVPRTLRSAIWTQTDPETPHSEIDDAVVQALGELLFASVMELTQRLCCVPTTIYCHLSESLHFIFNHL
jgi:hypothetical protein